MHIYARKKYRDARGCRSTSGRQNNPSFHNAAPEPASLLAFARVLAPLRAALARPPTTGTNASAVIPRCYHKASKQVSKRAARVIKRCSIYRKKKEQERKGPNGKPTPNPGITSFFSIYLRVSSCGHPAGSHPAQTSNCVPETLCFGTAPPLPSSSPLAARRVQKVSPTSKQMPLGY